MSYAKRDPGRKGNDYKYHEAITKAFSLFNFFFIFGDTPDVWKVCVE